MMQQYLQIKERYQDAILFFRLGDFYEMFFEDAHTASKILDIALTSRNKSDDGSVPLCGVPYHSAEPYIQKLLDAGHKVAVCEQVEDPALAKGVVKREVVRVITPGTVTAVEALDARGNNFLAAVCKGTAGFGLARDRYHHRRISLHRSRRRSGFLDEIGRIQPSEILLAEPRRPAARTALQRISRDPFHHGGATRLFIDSAERSCAARACRSASGHRGRARGVGDPRLSASQRRRIAEAAARSGTLIAVANYFVAR